MCKTVEGLPLSVKEEMPATASFHLIIMNSLLKSALRAECSTACLYSSAKRKNCCGALLWRCVLWPSDILASPAVANPLTFLDCFVTCAIMSSCFFFLFLFLYNF